MSCENNILPLNYYLFILSILLCISLIYSNIDKFNHKNEIKYKYSDNILVKMQKQLDQVLDDKIFLEKKKYLINRDKNVAYDNFKPPERRLPEYAYPDDQVQRYINFPTRGYPDTFQLMGLVMRNNTETIYNLYGRQKYPGSNQYEYYVQTNLNNNNVKIPIKINGDKEIYDGDNITIPGTNDNNGTFHVKLYDYDVPRYMPY